MSHNKLSLVNSDAPDEPWYADGLPFKCTGCGECCTGGPGAVWINDEEVTALANHLQVDEDTFIKEYTCLIDGRRSLREKKNNYDCIFLKDHKCSVYLHRPTQCRTYPFWPKHLASKKAWDEASRWCEGMTPDAPLVPAEEVERQLKIHLSSDAH